METIKNISYAVFHGVCDSIKGIGLVFFIDSHINRLNEKATQPNTQSEESQEKRTQAQEERRIGSKATTAPAATKKGEMKVAKQIFKCCGLNGGFAWLSILLFEYALLPSVEFMLSKYYGDSVEEKQYVWKILKTVLTFLFDMTWVLPIFLLSKIVNSLWFQDIANEAFKFRKGRPQLIPNVSKLIADFLFSMLVQVLFLFQTILMKQIPFDYVGMALNLIHLSLLYSLYSFEYKWFNMGWELHKRLNYIECNWPYFLGFGFPLAFLTSFTNSTVVSSCIFSIFFPLFILSGTEAQPVVGACDTPLRLFSPVIALSNLMFNRTMGGIKQTPDPSTHIARQKHSRTIQQDRNEPQASNSSRSSSHQSSVKSSNIRMR